jgi:hypothetical protein
VDYLCGAQHNRSTKSYSLYLSTDNNMNTMGQYITHLQASIKPAVQLGAMFI